jgi:hypothetical protein
MQQIVFPSKNHHKLQRETVYTDEYDAALQDASGSVCVSVTSSLPAVVAVAFIVSAGEIFVVWRNATN